MAKIPSVSWSSSHVGRVEADRAQRAAPAKGGYLFCNRNVSENAWGIMQAEENQDEYEDREEWLEANCKREPGVPPDGGGLFWTT